jgi:hypothetical protein
MGSISDQENVIDIDDAAIGQNGVGHRCRNAASQDRVVSAGLTIVNTERMKSS